MEAVDYIVCATVLVLFYPLMSLAEWAIHSRLMHRLPFPEWFYRWVPGLRRLYLAHAKVHHSHCFQDRFDHDPKLYCNLFNLTLDMPWVGLLCIAGPLCLLSYWGAGLLVLLTFLHHQAWGLVHTEMHIPTRPWLRKLLFYRVMARHHELHHQRPGYNFCVVCLGADRWMGTLITK